MRHNGQENTNSTRQEWGLCVRVLVYIRTKCLGLRDVHRVQSAAANAADMGCNVLTQWECIKNRNRIRSTTQAYIHFTNGLVKIIFSFLKAAKLLYKHILILYAFILLLVNTIDSTNTYFMKDLVYLLLSVAGNVIKMYPCKKVFLFKVFRLLCYFLVVFKGWEMF